MTGNNNAIQVYMQELSRHPVLSREQEQKLAAEIETGNEQARQILITCNLRLVVKIAHDFRDFGLPLIDLIAEGNLGLMRAVDKFDPSKGAKFSSYASWWIKQRMRRAINDQSRTVRIPAHSRSKLSHIKSESRSLEQKLGRPPTNAELAAKLNYSEQSVAVLQRTVSSSLSLHDFLREDSRNGTLEDVLESAEDHNSSNQTIEENEIHEQIFANLEKLDERERTIIVRRFGLDGNPPWTLDELSNQIGKTRERIRQIQFNALKKLKKIFFDQGRSGVSA